MSTSFATTNETKQNLNTSQYTAAGSPGAEGTTSFTSKQINVAATKVKTFIDKYHYLPDSVYIGNSQLTMPQFLKLMTYNLIYINNGNPKPVSLTIVNDPSIANENVVKSGYIPKSEYITIAKRINTYLKDYGKAPSRTYSSLGLVRFQNLVYTYSKILSFKDVKGRLPHTAYIKPWVYRPVYIISDIINNVSYDNDRIDTLVSALKKLGVNAYNKGVGTDNIGIFNILPSNALLVQICGGACAGTIKENGSIYYKFMFFTFFCYFFCFFFFFFQAEDGIRDCIA
jgi:hypothetical protein